MCQRNSELSPIQLIISFQTLVPIPRSLIPKRVKLKLRPRFGPIDLSLRLEMMQLLHKLSRTLRSSESKLSSLLSKPLPPKLLPELLKLMPTKPSKRPLPPMLEMPSEIDSPNNSLQILPVPKHGLRLMLQLKLHGKQPKPTKKEISLISNQSKELPLKTP